MATCTYTYTVQNRSGQCQITEEKVTPDGTKQINVYRGARKKIEYGIDGSKTEYYAKKAPDGRCCVYKQRYKQIPGGFVTDGSEEGPLFCEGDSPVVYRMDCSF